MSRFDVCVVGGGSAGLAAAVSAARLGAQTLLVERGGSLGGMVSAALVHSICGLYLLPETTLAQGYSSVGRMANRGFAPEFAARLIQSAGGAGPVRMGKVDVLLQHPTVFAQVADSFARETPNLQIRFHTELLAISDDFHEAVLYCRGRHEIIQTRTIVDASGDAVATALGGAASEQEASERLQRPAFIFALQGVEPAALGDEGRLKIARRLATAVQEGVLPAGALGVTLRSSGRGGEAFVTIDLEAPDYDPLDAICLTLLEMRGRSLAGQIAGFLQAGTPGFQASFISAFPARVGVRESRRMVGLYRLETLDMEQGARFPDAVALASWPMELRETNRGPRLRYPLDNRPCEIPLRALRARDHAALFAAGRCISCSHEAQASVRVIGTCLATGEAAGIAAALLALDNACEAEAVCASRERIHSARP